MNGQRKALIIANDEYEQEGLRNLLAAAADAQALGRVLSDPQIGDFTIRVVRNEPRYVIEEQIEDLFSESRPDDVLLMHFSGHGLKSESGELFFAASNTRPNRLRATAISADFVQQCMQATRSRSVVLLLDCCYGGAFTQGVRMRASGDVNVLDSFPEERTGGGRGRAVITASNAMEFAFEGEQLGDDQHRRPSVFTSALVEGLTTGDADQDEDGWVSLDELYNYVFDKVREQNPHQTPSRQVQLEGDLYLARSRRRRIRPVPIPPDLQAALTDTSMYARLGAVSELRSRLASDNLPAAAGAYEALAELARNDVRTVAEPAAAALSQAAVHPEETELHFGQLKQGSAPQHRTIRLLGPPIARACVPHPSDDWIHLDETAEGFDVSVDTTGTGTLRGTLDLKGPTGQAVIAIDVHLIPPAPVAPAVRPPIRSGAAFSGTGLALLAGVANIISLILDNHPSAPAAYTFFTQANPVIAIAIAVAVLLPRHRLVTIGLLQGMQWISAAAVVSDIAFVAVNYPLGYTGRSLAGFITGTIGDVLGFIAVILLVISWSLAAGSRCVPPLRGLPLMLLCSVGLSLIVNVIWIMNDQPSAYEYAFGPAEIVVGLAVTWYAMTLRAHPLGGALVLGWIICALHLVLAPMTGYWPTSTGVIRLASVSECILLAIAMILAIIYMRRPSNTESKPPHPVTNMPPTTAD
jgi:hypothetical protein